MIRGDGGTLRLEGAVTHANARRLLEEGRRLLANRDMEIDLGAVAETDSCIVGLLLDWRRACAARGRRLAVANAPAPVQALARVYGVHELLGLDG
ncbi:MAG TPA: STAS domain-containing protein [Pelomicrobium sp.]|nr:STAS domain-containing protein [Pelomicrobium sp.]